jgi:hypothetical protein
MTSASAAADLDRLPWLTDEKRPAPKRAPRPLLPAALGLGLAVAGASFWLGMRSVGDEPAPIEHVPPAQPSATIALPEPQVEAVAPMPVQSVEPMRVPPPAAEPVRHSARAQPKPPKVMASRPTAAVRTSHAPLALWPAWRSAVAAGRMVRIGTFSSSLQAKRAWGRIMRIYPGMRRLPAVVVSARSMRDGRSYYRLQMGTTSHAHSEVLCQRMRIVAVSCVVVGLPPR